MFKKLFLFLALLAFLATPAFASVGVRVGGTLIGTATDLYFPAGTTYTFDGSTFGTSTLTGAVAAITSGTIGGASIDTSPVGANTPSTGAFTTLSASGAITGATTAAITGNTTVGGTLGVTGATTLTGAVTTVSTVVGPGGGYGIYNIRKRVTLAQLNTGYVTPYTLVTAVTGRKIRLINCKMISYGGAMAHTATATGVAIYGTQSTQQALYTVNIAQLGESVVNTIGTASTAVLADGASFVDNDAATAITIGAVGAADLITATGVDVDITYAIE